MNLHENPDLFKQAVRFTAQKMEISDIYIEKDYWVTLALHTIFHHEIGKETVFKGGLPLLNALALLSVFRKILI